MLFEEFMKQYPDIKIETVSFPAPVYSANLEALMSGQQPVDVIFIKEISQLGNLADEGVLKPLDFLVSQSGISPESLIGYENLKSTTDNTHYAMPYRVEKYFLYYNRDVFDITGIPYPTQNITWHEFQEIGFAMNQKLKELGMSEKKAILLLPDGNDLLRMTIPGLSSLIGGDMQQFGHSLDLMEQLLAEGTTISFAQSYEQNFQQNVFETGNYGMFITSSSYAPLLLDKQKDGKLDFDWGVVSQPFWPEEKSGNNIKIIIPICIYRYTKYPEAAWKFVSFMSGEQGASLTAENLLFPAYDSETVQKTLISAAQRHQIKADLVDNARRSSLPACPTASEIDIFSFISNEYMDTLMGLITKDQCIRKIEDLHSRFPK